MKILAWSLYIIAAALAIYTALFALGFLLVGGFAGAAWYGGYRIMRRIKARDAVTAPPAPAERLNTRTGEVHFE